MYVLIAEDEPDTADFIRRGLEALARLTVEAFDLAVLDRMMPLLDGLGVLQAARAAGESTPVLMLTALGRIEDRVEGLEAGADDYLVKPFAMQELVARLHAIQRRRDAGGEGLRIVGELMLDTRRRELRHAGRAVPLQPREMRLLEELMRNARRIVTRSMLLEAVWGFHFDPQTNLVETHMSRLRTKLALGGARDVIETVRGAGYRLRGAG